MGGCPRLLRADRVGFFDREMRKAKMPNQRTARAIRDPRSAFRNALRTTPPAEVAVTPHLKGGEPDYFSSFDFSRIVQSSQPHQERIFKHQPAHWRRPVAGGFERSVLAKPDQHLPRRRRDDDPVFLYHAFYLGQPHFHARFEP